MDLCRSTKLLLIVVSLLFTSVAGQYDDDLSSSAAEEANEFMDELLAIQMPKILSERSEEIVRDFPLRIRKKLFAGILPTHRDINAYFSGGKVTGFLGIRRNGDCKPTFLDDHYIVISCKLDIGSLKATYASSITGFNLLGTIAHRAISVHLNGTLVNFEARQAVKSSVSPHISALFIDTLRCEVQYEPVGFNAERDRLFREEIVRNVQPQLIRVLNGRVHQSLQDALRQDGVNIPEVRT